MTDGNEVLVTRIENLEKKVDDLIQDFMGFVDVSGVLAETQKGVNDELKRAVFPELFNQPKKETSQ